MLYVYLLRHGETTWNADGNRYCGLTDVELTENGLRQAENAAKLLTPVTFDAVYSSPLRRALVTADIASRRHPSLTADERLREASFGSWEGKTREEFIAENPGLWQSWAEDPAGTRAGGNGETAREVVERVDGFFEEIQKRHPAGRVLVVAHNTVNRLYMCWKLGMPLKNYRRLVQENSSVTVLGLGGAEGFSLLKLNCGE